MAERPILILPSPEPTAPPRGGGRSSAFRLPGRDRQIERFGPLFDRLRTQLDRGNALILCDDPASLAPERVIVFDIAGSVEKFVAAISRVPGFEFMGEKETELTASEEFGRLQARPGMQGEVHTDSEIRRRFYLAMPDVEALGQLVSLWRRWEQGRAMRNGFTAFRDVFRQLHDLRPWGPQDRIPPETIRYWREEIARDPNRPVRSEIELWYRATTGGRQAAFNRFRDALDSIGGTLIAQATLPEIAYHAALVDLPQNALADLIARTPVHLALADEVMFLRPQSQIREPAAVVPLPQEAPTDTQVPPARGNPVVALFDGVPLQRHALLADRLRLNDPDELEPRSVVSARAHGTAMASLVLHGDLNMRRAPLARPLYVRPIMHAAGPPNIEQTAEDKLLVDTLHRAVLEMKGSTGSPGTSPEVFLVNLSMGDLRRPFAGVVSPLARLLDFLSFRYNLLFMVSAGNIGEPLPIPAYRTWTDFERADADHRAEAVVAALQRAKHERTLLSPAESINALTIGGLHRDQVDPRPTSRSAIDPFGADCFPNISSALGLGYRRSIKPDLLVAGGRELVRASSTGNILRIVPAEAPGLYGLAAAAPDPGGRGDLTKITLSAGTSSSTALATHSAARIFEQLTSAEDNGPLSNTDPRFRAVMVKALLVHGARWSENLSCLDGINEGIATSRHAERQDNLSRFIGFGTPDIDSVTECAFNRATMIGCGSLNPLEAHVYRIPLPECLQSVTHPRSLTVTLGWMSPVKSSNLRYRAVRLEAAPVEKALQALGVKRLPHHQPADDTIQRGTVFHECFQGNKAVPFIDDGHLSLRIWCREDAGFRYPEPIHYGLAVSIASETRIPIYDQIRARIAARIPATP